MLRRAISTAKARGDGEPKGQKRCLSLRGSPVMRLAAAQVGRGAAAGTFTDMARAAGEEAGRKNLSSSSRWAAGRKSVKNAERDVNRALKRSGDGVTCMIV